MRNKWKSYIYVPVIACILAAGGAYMWNAKSDNSPDTPQQIYYLDEYFEADTEKPDEAHAVDEKNVVLENVPEQTAEVKAQFMLKAVDNFVYVYLSENPEESFMPTGICMDELPEVTQKEIMAGKEILDEEALYFFLESHSS